MFCAIPTPFSHVWDENSRSLMLTVFPFVGTIIGSIWALVLIILNKLNIPILFSSALLTLVPYLLTGGIHLDGYMDCCDAVFSRRPLEKRREILKDSHIGSFAVIGIIILMMLGFSAFASAQNSVGPCELIIICTVSRACSAIGVSTLRPMSHSEYAGNFQKDISRLNIAILCIIILVSFVLSYFVYGYKGFVVSVITALGYILATAYAFKDLDGFSGDVTGFGHTIAELCGIIAFNLI